VLAVTHTAGKIRGGTTDAGSWVGAVRPSLVWKDAIFIFIFYFRFLQKYIFVFKIYRNIPAALLPGSRDLVAPLRGGRGFSAKKL